MTSYLLCLYQDNVPDDISQLCLARKQQATKSKVKNILYPKEFIGRLPATTYIACLAFSHLYSTKKFTWKKLTPNFALSTSPGNNSNSIENLDELLQYCSEVIHTLADHLPSSKSYFLEVLLDSNLFSKLQVDSYPRLKEALFRLRLWHHANLRFLGSSQEDDNVKKWMTFLELPDLPDSPSIWQGNILVQSSNQSQSVSLLGYKMVAYQVDCDILNPVMSSNDNKRGKLIELSSCFEALHEFDCAQLPLDSVWPFPFLLKVDSASIFKESREFLANVNKKHGQCTLLRLLYIESNGKLEGYKLTTESWKVAVMQNKFTLNDLLRIVALDNFFYFVLVGDGLTSDHATLYLLHPNTTPFPTALVPYDLFTTMFSIQAECLAALAPSDDLKTFLKDSQSRILQRVNFNDIMKPLILEVKDVKNKSWNLFEHLDMFKKDGNSAAIDCEPILLPKKRKKYKPNVTLEEVAKMDDLHLKDIKTHDVYYNRRTMEEDLEGVSNTQVHNVPYNTESFYSRTLKQPEPSPLPRKRSYLRTRSCKMWEEPAPQNNHLTNGYHPPLPLNLTYNNIQRSKPISVCRPFKCPVFQPVTSTVNFRPPCKKPASLLDTTPKKTKLNSSSSKNIRASYPKRKLFSQT